ncbi:MAG TPA: aldolase/citrate lyase family protein [Abditibacteriaceae bacterium]|nr:aldolase/citrate lyase family protein [Abditibacteriaceae bacterium]
MALMNGTQKMHPREALRQKFTYGWPTYGLWVTLESPSITEIAGHLGVDWVVIDAEHGHLDLKNVLEHVRVANLMNLVCFVRVQEIQQGLIKRALDIGADGILVPQVRSAEEVATAVRFAKYPPEGIRGIGAERSTRWGMGMVNCTRSANDSVMVIPLMETVEAGDAIEDILDVPGVDALFFGPADYSASAGFLGEWEGPGVAERLLEIQARIRARRIPTGIVATGHENLQLRKQQNFQMIALGIDAGLLIRAARGAMEAAGIAPPEQAWQCKI